MERNQTGSARQGEWTLEELPTVRREILWSAETEQRISWIRLQKESGDQDSSLRSSRKAGWRGRCSFRFPPASEAASGIPWYRSGGKRIAWRNLEPLQSCFYGCKPPSPATFRSAERIGTAQSGSKNCHLRNCRSNWIWWTENILGLGEQDAGSDCSAKQMEDNRIRSPKDECEDLRTLPSCLRWLLQKERRILQGSERRNERESGKEESTLRKGRSTEGQHRLESNCWCADQIAERVENNRSGSQEILGCRMETFHHCLWLFLRPEKQGYFFTTFCRNREHGEEESVDWKISFNRWKHGYWRSQHFGTRTDEGVEYHRSCSVQGERQIV